MAANGNRCQRSKRLIMHEDAAAVTTEIKYAVFHLRCKHGHRADSDIQSMRLLLLILACMSKHYDSTLAGMQSLSGCFWLVFGVVVQCSDTSIHSVMLASLCQNVTARAWVWLM